MRNDWQTRREAGTAFMVRFIRWFALHASESVARAFLYPITAYFLLMRHSERRASRRYLRLVLQRKPRLLDIARHIHTFATTILDRAFLLSGRFDSSRVRVHGLPQLLEHLNAGCGVMLLGSHLGSFEAMRAIGLEHDELRLRIVMDYQHNEQLTRLLDALNQRARDSTIDAAGDSTRVLFEIHETLAAGGMVGMLADRARSDEPTIQCELLQLPVALPAGPFRIAAILGKPVMLIFGILNHDGSYDVYFEPFADQQEIGARSQRQELINTWARRYAQRLEQRLRAAPFNWFNFYDFWAIQKTSPTNQSVHTKHDQGA